MATIEATPIAIAQQKSIAIGRGQAYLYSAALSLLAIVIHGYHPYAEDGGIYLPGIEKLLHPELFPRWASFVTVHARWSLFAPAIAALVRLTHFDLMVVVGLVHLACIFATLVAGWQIASACGFSDEGCCGAVSVLALCLAIPVAGTSLLLMDPYLTARSISTPCSLFALAGTMRAVSAPGWKNAAMAIGSLAIAAAIHPLMAAYAFGCVLLLVCLHCNTMRPRILSIAGVCLFCLTLALLLSRLFPAEEPAYAAVARTRSYWFLSQWHWYEWIGLIAPPAVLALVWGRGGFLSRPATRLFAQMAIVAGSLAVIVALLFCRESSANYLVARLQPLRVFQTIYALMLIALGTWLGEKLLRNSAPRWIAAGLLLGLLMFTVSRKTFPSSPHIELPLISPANPWEQGFLWIRNNTPVNAVFALDADYITAPGEDAQNFRAIAERSVLPDFAKDGGAAAIAPELTSQWAEGVRLQSRLDRLIRSGRSAELASTGVDWVVLSAGTATRLACPYGNTAIKVCALR